MPNGAICLFAVKVLHHGAVNESPAGAENGRGENPAADQNSLQIEFGPRCPEFEHSPWPEGHQADNVATMAFSSGYIYAVHCRVLEKHRPVNRERADAPG